MMFDQQSASKAYQRRWRTSEDQFTFGNTEELIGFVQTEIYNSDMTYKAIAAKAGCCVSTVSKMGAGSTRFPRLNTVFEILRVLGYSVVVRK